MDNKFLGEKVSVNINTSTLSAIDLLVDNGYYSNRSDFINQALRESIQRHQSTIDRIADRSIGDRIWFMGVYNLSSADLKEISVSKKQIPITGYGLLIIDERCDEAALFSSISEIRIKGKVICSQSVKDHYSLR